jgi:hypothetical protein
MSRPLRTGGALLLCVLAGVLSLTAGLLALPQMRITSTPATKSNSPGAVKPCRI